MNECIESDISKYKTFCDFFTRKLKPGIHKIDKSNQSIVSSCDGKILEFGNIKNDSIVQVKGKLIKIAELLDNDNSSIKSFENGSFASIYLSPKDYHRVHMPYKGKLSKTIHVPGRLYSVAKHAVTSIKNLYSRNERLACNFKGADINFSVIFIAAINVSSIETVWKGEASPPYPKKTIRTSYDKKKIVLEKGNELGMFKTGSTVILLFDKRIDFLQSLKKGKNIRVGNRIGKISSKIL